MGTQFLTFEIQGYFVNHLEYFRSDQRKQDGLHEFLLWIQNTGLGGMSLNPLKLKWLQPYSYIPKIHTDFIMQSRNIIWIEYAAYRRYIFGGYYTCVYMWYAKFRNVSWTICPLYQRY